MSEPVEVEIVESSRSSASASEVRALVRVEEIRLERTKIHAGAFVIAVFLLSWAAVCHATC